MKPAIVFLDDGGVLHDNERRSAEWQRLLGEYLTPRLGGTPGSWGEANRTVFDAQWRRFEEWAAADAHDEEYIDFFGSGDESSRWLTEMCYAVGVQPPTGARCIAIAVSAQRYVRSRVQAGFVEAPIAVRSLFNAGYTLATSSGSTSEQLAGYLNALGVRDCFKGRLYGPDLVRAHKAGPVYYERILTDAGVDPSDALVVDDNPKAIGWAAEAGIPTVHIHRDSAAASDATHAVRDLNELAELLNAS